MGTLADPTCGLPGNHGDPFGGPDLADAKEIDPRTMQTDLVKTLREFNRTLETGYRLFKPYGDPNEHPQIQANNALLAKYDTQKALAKAADKKEK